MVSCPELEIRKEGGPNTTCNSYTQHEMPKSVPYFFSLRKQRSEEVYRSTSLKWPVLTFLSFSTFPVMF